jgi:hypothetical protein
MEALLAALQAGGGGAAAAIAAAVVVLAALYFARMVSKERANTPPGDHQLTKSRVCTAFSSCCHVKTFSAGPFITARDFMRSVLNI